MNENYGPTPELTPPMTNEPPEGRVTAWLKECKQQYESDQRDYEFIRLETEEWEFAREVDAEIASLQARLASYKDAADALLEANIKAVNRLQAEQERSERSGVD